jgi:predicted RNA-binding Zn-ribbon protein involved in translation (DUF1610 family)
MENKPYIFKCSGCGASKVFSPKYQALWCPHCGGRTEVTFNKNIVKKPYYKNEINSVVPDPDISIKTCTSCGAQLNMLSGEIAAKCPFCGTGNIVLKEDIKGLKPDECIPFSIEPSEAESGFKKWLSKKWFLPSELKRKAKSNRVDANNLTGIYSPCYAYDTKSFSSYSGVLGKHYIEYVGTGKNRRAVVRTRYFSISGNYNKDFFDVMIECSPHFDQKVLDKIRPFNLNDSVVYDKCFLSGFSADTYDKDLNTGWAEAEAKLDEDIKRGILSKYSYDVIQSLNINTSYNDIKYSYMLLPVYVAGFKFKENLYNFFVNGNSGKIFGKVPRSPLKIFFAALIGAAVLIGAALLISTFNINVY